LPPEPIKITPLKDEIDPNKSIKPYLNDDLNYERIDEEQIYHF